MAEDLAERSSSVSAERHGHLTYHQRVRRTELNSDPLGILRGDVVGIEVNCETSHQPSVDPNERNVRRRPRLYQPFLDRSPEARRRQRSVLYAIRQEVFAKISW